MPETITWTIYEADTRLHWWTSAGAPDFLSALEARRLERLRFPKRRREWLLGRWTMKKLLQADYPACVDRLLSEIEIEYEPDGAPYLIHPGGKDTGSISISHREDAAACAFAPGLVMGIDLEQVEPRSEAFIHDFFTADEAARALELRGVARDVFTALVWSAKESALKALRTGLRVDTRAVEVVGHSQPGDDGWGKVIFASRLAELQGIEGWWRVDGGRLITIAAMKPAILKFVPIS